MDAAISLLKDLVSIDSVNPSLVAGGAGEGQIAQAVADRMRRGGLDVTMEDVEPGRPNVVGVLDGRERGRSLMLCGHLDTVGVEGMADPFTARERDGLLYGRGAQDMKGGVAAMVDAACRLAADGFSRGRVIVAAVIDEEFASLGAEALVRRWSADAAVVTEPTDLHIGVGHRGFAWVDVETRGRAAHGSRPRDGRDAIMRMGRILHALERLDRELQSRAPDGVLGTGSLHASIISGGRELSVYPDQCLLRMERRTVSREDGQTAVAEVREIIRRLTADDSEFEATATLMFSRPAYAVPVDHPLPGALQRTARACGAPAHASGLSFWTDAAILAAAGIPSVLFGPGGGGLHSTEEYVNVEDVVRCRNVLAAFARQWCGN